MTDEVSVDGSTSLAVRLRRAEAAIRARLLPLLVDNDLSMEHWRIMAVIDDHPGLGMSTVAVTAVVPAATLTRHMDKLVERGVVVRHVDPSDKRRVVVALSPRGQALAARLRQEERRVDDPAIVDVIGTDPRLQVSA